MRKLSETLSIARRYLLTGPRQIYSGRLCAAMSPRLCGAAMRASWQEDLRATEAYRLRHAVMERLNQQGLKLGLPAQSVNTISGLYAIYGLGSVVDLANPNFIKFRDEWLDTWQSELEAEEAKDQSTPKGTST